MKALNLEQEMRRRVGEDTMNVERVGNKLARVMNRSTPMMETLGGVVVGGVLICGGYSIVMLNEPPGQFLSFIAAFLLAYEPAKRIVRLNIDLSHALAGVEVLFDILDLPDRSGDDNRPLLTVDKGRIVFSGVNFSYRREGTPVLRALSLTAEPGQITALVGPSGGGKTTIFNLLLRFYRANEGEMAIDGQNLASVSQSSVRANIAYVGQDIFPVSGHRAGEHRHGQARRQRRRDRRGGKSRLCTRFHHGAAGRLRHAGRRARHAAFGRPAPADLRRASDDPQRADFLLDEPTSSLDSEFEVHVQQAIRRLAEGRTTLVIAHRINTIRDADVIHVVEEGRVVESGRHEDLLRAGRRYADFYHSQFGDLSAAAAAQSGLGAGSG